MPRAEDLKPIFLGYEIIGGVKFETWRYVDLHPRPSLRRPDLFQEPTWEVRREGDKCFFEFLAARQGGGTDIHEIREDAFRAVQAGELDFEGLLRKYDR